MNEICSKHEPQFVKSIIEGGRTQLRKQCFICGEVEDKIYKFSECSDIYNLPILDKDLREKFYTIQSKERRLEYEIQKEKRKQEYANYLQSYEWKRKHKYIMEKYGYRCVLCFKPAVNVHHLTYNRVYFEDERDLIALCKNCHEFVHGFVDDSSIL